MLLVVFGAGASYDSDPYNRPDYDPAARIEHLPVIEEHRPPLSNRLFDHRHQFVDTMNQFPECKPLVSHLRRAGVAVEQELARFLAEGANYPERHRQLSAVLFYLRQAIWDCQIRWSQVHNGVTNYLAFLDEIERWRSQMKETVCFVTFNYDTLLEEAMEQLLKLRADSMHAYYNWPNYSLFKLHGSVNWGREVRILIKQNRAARDFYNKLINMNDRGRQSPILGEHHLCDRDMEPTDKAEVVLYPMLSIPLHKKDEFSCPQAHVDEMKSLLPNVTKMITIGWRGAEEEFLKALISSKKTPTPGVRNPIRLFVITASRTGVVETAQNIMTVGGDCSDLFMEFQPGDVVGGFSGLMDNWKLLRTFLELN